MEAVNNILDKQIDLFVVDEQEKKIDVADRDEKVVVKDLTQFNAFKKKRFLKDEMAVPLSQVKKDKAFIQKCLRTGIELETPFIDNNNRSVQDSVRRMITSNYNVLNDYGVERYYNDYTVSPFGYEIVFSGSNEDFEGYHSRLKKVESKLKNLAVKGYETNNGSSSCHITLLTSQFKKLPTIYLMNFYQLYRKYADALLWLGSATYENRKEEIEYLMRIYSGKIRQTFADENMSSEKINNIMRGFNSECYDLLREKDIFVNGGSGAERIINENRIVRRGLLQYANPIMTKSPIKHSAKNLMGFYKKYRGVNFEKQNFTRGNNYLNGLMVEVRSTDRIAVPSALTSIKCLYEAMLFKAIDLSQYGIINVECNGVLNAWQKTKETVYKICNGEKLSKSDTSYLQKKSVEFLKMLKTYFMRGNEKAFDILNQLAEKPISMRYREGKKNSKIEKELIGSKKREYKSEIALRQIMDLLLIEAKNSVEWKRKASKVLGISERSVEHNISKINDSGEKIFFDEEVKSYVVV